MPTCMGCLRGFPEECREGDCDRNSSAQQTPDEGNNGSVDHSNGERSTEEQERTARHRRNKPDAALKDQQSTGRKRAAKLYPLNPESDCEWRFGINVGGGDFPIQGCLDGKQLHRHHGPDKNTLNNEPGNVWRICHFCHNRWHSANDKDYDPNKPLKD